jgi:hypothetical protein
MEDFEWSGKRKGKPILEINGGRLKRWRGRKKPLSLHRHGGRFFCRIKDVQDGYFIVWILRFSVQIRIIKRSVICTQKRAGTSPARY